LFDFCRDEFNDVMFPLGGFCSIYLCYLWHRLGRSQYINIVPDLLLSVAVLDIVPHDVTILCLIFWAGSSLVVSRFP
jgi:hypothetical protein